MHLIPITTRRIESNDDLVTMLLENETRIQQNDIIAISSKAIATAEGRILDLKKLKITKEAKDYAKICGRSPEFCQAVLEEVTSRNGKVVGTCSGAIITELKPRGLSQGVILTANAGLDESNAPSGTAIGWPENPVESVKSIRNTLIESPAILITDSCVRPRRWGVTAYTLACAGIDPLQDEAGKHDLFGRTLHITQEAIADQLATAANMLMGNTNQSTPAVIIRDHGITLSNYVGWVPGIKPEEDLFNGII